MTNAMNHIYYILCDCACASILLYKAHVEYKIYGMKMLHERAAKECSKIVSVRTHCGVIHGAGGTCSSYGDLPPVMIQGHQQPGGDDDDDGDVSGDDVESHNL